MSATDAASALLVRELRSVPDVELALECTDEAPGYHAFFVIHSTVRGRTVGGIRRARYPSRTAALEEAVELARTMSYKSALADLPFGGGKSVIWDEGHAAWVKAGRSLLAVNEFPTKSTVRSAAGSSFSGRVGSWLHAALLYVMAAAKTANEGAEKWRIMRVVHGLRMRARLS